MARHDASRKNGAAGPPPDPSRHELGREVVGLILIALGLLILISLVFPQWSGALGRFLPGLLKHGFGAAAAVLPLLVIIVGLQLIYSHNPLPLYWLILALFIFLASASSALSVMKLEWGGSTGRALVEALSGLVGLVGTGVLVVVVGLVDVLLIAQLSLKELVESALGWMKKLWAWLPRRSASPRRAGQGKERVVQEERSEFEENWSGQAFPADEPVLAPEVGNFVELEAHSGEGLATAGQGPLGEAVRVVPGPEAPAVLPDPAGPFTTAGVQPALSGSLAGAGAASAAVAVAAAEGIPGQMELFPGSEPNSPQNPPVSGTGRSRHRGRPAPAGRPIRYRLPPLSLLRGIEKEIRNRAPVDYSEILRETLASFGVEVKILDILRGPSVTRYELQPARGVKVSKITSLTNDIALSLAAPSIRIEAPIPGKSAIGIEVPNLRIDPVHVKEILESPAHRNGGLLSFALGKDITGHPVVGDLARMPHLLIAGATGSGKTVCLNSIMASFLYKATPDQVQFIIIDPKRVELIVYEGIPHIIDAEGNGDRRVVTSAPLATKVLKWLTMEMDRRYDSFADARCKNLQDYNQRMLQEGKLHLPYIVLVMDELADLMMLSAATVESSICRLAQLGRAAGIHLMVATQRPSVDVITGIIKANIPSRVAFAVSSQVDSRTILDEVGAEKLLGKGDMLYKPIDAPDPRRIQGAFIDTEEIEKLVEFWEVQPDPPNRVNIVPGNGEEEAAPEEDLNEEDSLFQEALGVIRRTHQASASMLQRKLKVGYARAGRLIDLMERKGLVGPAEGSKPRKILFKLESEED